MSAFGSKPVVLMQSAQGAEPLAETLNCFTHRRERARGLEHVVLTQRYWQCALPVSTF